jgi:hypothetical protein
MLSGKKCCTILLVWLLMRVCAFAQTATWQGYTIDSQLTVRFSVEPQELDVPQTMAANNAPSKQESQVLASRAFRAEDAVATYVLVSIPLAGNSYFASPPAERESYLKKRSIPLMVMQMRGELLAQKVNIQPGLDSFTIKLRVLGANGSPVVKYVRVLTEKQRIYQLYFMPKDGSGVEGASQRAMFLDSLTFAPGK